MTGNKKAAYGDHVWLRKLLFLVISPALLSDIGITADFSPFGNFGCVFMFGFRPFRIFWKLSRTYVDTQITRSNNTNYKLSNLIETV